MLYFSASLFSEIPFLSTSLCISFSISFFFFFPFFFHLLSHSYISFLCFLSLLLHFDIQSCPFFLLIFSLLHFHEFNHFGIHLVSTATTFILQITMFSLMSWISMTSQCHKSHSANKISSSLLPTNHHRLACLTSLCLTRLPKYRTNVHSSYFGQVEKQNFELLSSGLSSHNTLSVSTTLYSG